MLRANPTFQEVFDFVGAHLLKQNEKSLRPYIDHDASRFERCVYRDGRGHACAIGCCIPSGMYQLDMETMSLWDLSRNYPVLPNYFHDVTTYGPLFISLQQVHDRYPPKEWPGRLKEVADKHGLNFNLCRLLGHEVHLAEAT